MKRRRFVNTLFFLPLGIAGYAFAIRVKPPAKQHEIPPMPAESSLPVQFILPDTTANRALWAAVGKNDPKAVLTAFEQGADPNSSVVYSDYEASPANTRPKQKPTPMLLHIGNTMFGSPLVSDEEKNRQNAIAIFRSFLECGADPNVRFQDGRALNALGSLLMLEDKDLLRLALDKGANVNTVLEGTGNAVNQVLMQTIRGKEEKTTPLLAMVLEKGADPNLYDGAGLTPLHSAALLGLPKTAQMLLRHGANPSSITLSVREGEEDSKKFSYKATPLMLATRSANAEIIAMLMAAKPNLSAEEALLVGDVATLEKLLPTKLDPNQKDERGTPFLILVTASGKIEAVRLLLEHKANPDAKDTHGKTALYRAAILGHSDISRLLLSYGADSNIASGTKDFPETALTAAIREAEVDCVSLLLGYPGTNLSAPGNRDALRYAVQYAGSTLFRVMGKPIQSRKQGDAALEAQASIYDKVVKRFDVRKEGGPALCVAVGNSQFGIAEDLLHRGADINARDHEGKTVSMLTIESMGMTYDSMLPEGVMNQGKTPAEKKEMQEEAKADYKEAMAFFRLLLAKKPDLNAVTAPDFEEKETALSIARFWQLTEVSKLLKQAGAKR